MRRRKRRTWGRGSSRSQLQNWLDKAESYLTQDRPDKAMQVLEQVPERYRKNSEYRYWHGVCSLYTGRYLQAIEDLEDGLASEPQGSPRYLQLASAYFERAWLRHALLYASRYLKGSVGIPALDEQARGMIAEARLHVALEAAELNVPEDLFMRALLSHERAQRHLALGRFKQAIKECDATSRLVQNWASPLNNKALALFFSGNVNEAIRIEKRVLDTLDANNIHALGNLVNFHFSLLDDDLCQQYGERIRQVVAANPYDDLDLNKIIEAFAILEDAEFLWSVAEYVAQMERERLSGESWYFLGAAAANLGRSKEALRFLKNAQDMNAHPQKRVEQALQWLKNSRKKEKGFSLRGHFPYIHFTHYFPRHLFADFVETLPEDNETANRKFKQLLKRSPFVAGAFKLILWDEVDSSLRTFALEGLAAMDEPKAWEQLIAFGASQFGTNEQRIKVLQLVSEAGVLDQDAPFRFWDEGSGEWREVLLMLQEIAEPEGPICNEQASVWLEKATRIAQTYEGEPPEGGGRKAIAYLERAIEADPNCAVAWHNMGVQYIILGEKEKGEALIKRSIEIDPDYLFAYTTLAEIAYQRGDYGAAKEALRKVNTAKSLAPQVHLRSIATQFWIALKEKESEIAKNTVALLESLYKDYPELEDMKQALFLSEFASSWQMRRDEATHRYHQRKLKKAIAADEGLAACLNRNSREALTGTLRAWSVSRSGRKAEIIDRLVGLMLDEEALAYFIAYKLSDQEAQALRWLLEQGGICPWQDFTQRFGDDFDESPYWQWHEPDTVPGRLRMFGLLAVGTLNREQVALIPYELRAPLQHLLTP